MGLPESIFRVMGNPARQYRTVTAALQPRLHLSPRRLPQFLFNDRLAALHIAQQTAPLPIGEPPLNRLLDVFRTFCPVSGIMKVVIVVMMISKRFRGMVVSTLPPAQVALVR